MTDAADGTVVVHADEACLGNGREGATPGGAGGLVELRRRSGATERRDYFVAEPDTTNNRMALRSATEVLTLLDAPARRLHVVFVSDSNYLVRGMNEWLRGWKARGWKRKEGTKLVPVANEEQWRQLDELARHYDMEWRWVRGHAGHPRNEYANFLATRAAKEQHNSGGLAESGFEEWLASEREKGRYLDFDPDA